jgi:hypothetical protein
MRTSFPVSRSDDARSIVGLDATDSLQAPFVRRPWEVLEGTTPDGPPWGLSAAAAATRHSRRTRRSLSALADAGRKKLHVTDAARERRLPTSD